MSTQPGYDIPTIAACLALPVVEREMDRLQRQRPTGDNEVADDMNRKITAQMRPIMERHKNLLAAILNLPPDAR